MTNKESHCTRKTSAVFFFSHQNIYLSGKINNFVDRFLNSCQVDNGEMKIKVKRKKINRMMKFFS